MAVYAIIEISINNQDMYEEYVKRVKPIIEKHQGRYLVRGGNITPLFGNWHPERIVVIEFPSHENVKECFNSDEYKKVAGYRENSTTTKSIIVEGY